MKDREEYAQYEMHCRELMANYQPGASPLCVKSGTSRDFVQEPWVKCNHGRILIWRGISAIGMLIFFVLGDLHAKWIESRFRGNMYGEIRQTTHWEILLYQRDQSLVSLDEYSPSTSPSRNTALSSVTLVFNAQRAVSPHIPPDIGLRDSILPFNNIIPLNWSTALP